MSRLRIGLVGADAAGRGWGAVAHVPAIAAADGVELAAVCTRRPESAAAASAAYGVPGFHDVAEMAARPEVDLVAVVVKVPGHRDAVVAALQAGKHVFSEWPLGLDTAEAVEMAALAAEKGVVSAVGLQGRHTPELATMKALVEEGWVGRVLTVDVSWSTKGPRRDVPSSGVPGASLFAVGGGHTLDCARHVCGSIANWSARTDAAPGSDAGSIHDVALHGVLQGGGLLSYRLSAVAHHPVGWRMEIRGTEGVLVATTAVMPQISPVKLVGARGDEPLKELPLADGAVAVPEAPPGPPRNIAQSYARLASAIASGSRYRADFGDAVEVHRLLDAIRAG